MATRYMVPALVPLACYVEKRRLGQDTVFRFEEEIRRSRFITSLGRASSREEALSFVEAIRGDFPDATHNCWAFAAGAPGDTACIGQSDDGEPHGTAGKPMLNQLLFGKIGEIVAVTTRYFGGIKLGTGGLVRAYQGGVAQALELLPVKEKIIPVFLRVETDYARLNRIKRVLSDMDASIAEELFAENVCLTVSLSEELAEACKQALMQVSDGTARISACERYEAEE